MTKHMRRKGLGTELPGVHGALSILFRCGLLDAHGVPVRQPFVSVQPVVNVLLFDSSPADSCQGRLATQNIYGFFECFYWRHKVKIGRASCRERVLWYVVVGSRVVQIYVVSSSRDTLYSIVG